jgi:hypothetical protein
MKKHNEFEDTVLIICLSWLCHYKSLRYKANYDVVLVNVDIKKYKELFTVEFVS